MAPISVAFFLISFNWGIGSFSIGCKDGVGVEGALVSHVFFSSWRPVAVLFLCAVAKWPDGAKSGGISCGHRVSVGPVGGFRRLGAGAQRLAGEVRSACTVAAGGERPVGDENEERIVASPRERRCHIHFPKLINA